MEDPNVVLNKIADKFNGKVGNKHFMQGFSRNGNASHIHTSCIVFGMNLTYENGTVFHSKNIEALVKRDVLLALQETKDQIDDLMAKLRE